MSENQSNSNNSRIYGIIVTILLLLSAILGYFFWNKNKEFRAETERQKMEIIKLTEEKNRLAQSLDSLTISYSDLRTENETLTSRVASSAGLVQQKEVSIKQIRANLTQDIQVLRGQVAELERTKAELEAIVIVLREENSMLKSENAALKGENDQLKTDKTALTGQVDDLSNKLAEQIKKTQSAVFKATAFKVEVTRKDKTTGRARRARDMAVSFDLTDVPQGFQGPQTLYLVITDDKGNPIKTTNPTKKTIMAPAGAVEIIAQQTKAVDLTGTQRLSFNHKLEEKLAKGSYVVAIYCDKGLLGASSFRLS
jgi:FtsZ-binding cell division protein ZapB